MSKKDKKVKSRTEDARISPAQLEQISQAMRATILDIASGERGAAAHAKRVSVENPKHKTSKVKTKNKAVTSLPVKD